MTGRQEAAVSIHARGGNCAQAVLGAFCGELGLATEDALRVATAFGGGMGRTGSVCGAVSGACMVLGLRAGMRRPEEKDKKEAGYLLMQEFSRRFRQRFGDTSCPALLGLDIGTPGGMSAARERNLFETRCNDLIAAAVEILEEMGGV